MISASYTGVLIILLFFGHNEVNAALSIDIQIPMLRRSSQENSNEIITFHLYRKPFIDDPINFRLNDQAYMKILNIPTNYNRDLKTKVIFHGWQNHYQSSVDQMIKNAYLNKEDMNVFVVDWASSASTWYSTSAKETKTVGLECARFLDYLEAEGTSLSNIHLIGHSLGAHAAGYAGAHTKMGKVGRITGLDPAFPHFRNVVPDNRLDPTDAKFVDVIHTCAGVLGSDEKLGHADFWPNGGRLKQPGCSNYDDRYGACSHSRAYEYFAESIESEIPFVAYPCKNYKRFRKGKCKQREVVMGDETPSTARGSYYLRTSGTKPFAIK